MGNEFENDQGDIWQLVGRLSDGGRDLDRTLMALRARLNAHEVAAQVHVYPELIRACSEFTSMVHNREIEFRDIDSQLRSVELANGSGFADEVSQLTDVVDRQFAYENEMMSLLEQQVSSKRFDEVERQFGSRRDAELKSLESSGQTGIEPTS